jgi:hypothetical protein
MKVAAMLALAKGLSKARPRAETPTSIGEYPYNIYIYVICFKHES